MASSAVFAGCGIVAESEPLDEYQETELKLAGMRTAIRVLDAAAETPGRTQVSPSSMVD
ncbi:chorismate-binding protein [Burkholderia cenocepacia]|nr:chorismate-binding protein [Burkholderia cenocepacia]